MAPWTKRTKLSTLSSKTSDSTGIKVLFWFLRIIKGLFPPCEISIFPVLEKTLQIKILMLIKLILVWIAVDILFFVLWNMMKKCLGGIRIRLKIFLDCVDHNLASYLSQILYKGLTKHLSIWTKVELIFVSTTWLYFSLKVFSKCHATGWICF